MCQIVIIDQVSKVLNKQNHFRFDSRLRSHRLRLRPLRRVRAEAVGQGIHYGIVIIWPEHTRLVSHPQQRAERGRDGAVLLRLVLLPRHPRLPRRRIFCGSMSHRLLEPFRFRGELFLKKMGQPRPLFRLFSVFSNKP